MHRFNNCVLSGNLLKDAVNTIVCQEYGFHKWDESNGLDKFLNDTKLKGPTMYIKKYNIIYINYI